MASIRTAPKRHKKAKPKLKKPRSHPSPGEPIPLTRNELFRLHDIADSLKLLRDIAEEAPEMQLIQVEILISKAIPLCLESDS